MDSILQSLVLTLENESLAVERVGLRFANKRHYLSSTQLELAFESDCKLLETEYDRLDVCCCVVFLISTGLPFTRIRFLKRFIERSTAFRSAVLADVHELLHLSLSFNDSVLAEHAKVIRRINWIEVKKLFVCSQCCQWLLLVDFPERTSVKDLVVLGTAIHLV